jgi:hypothetical protein
MTACSPKTSPASAIRTIRVFPSREVVDKLGPSPAQNEDSPWVLSLDQHHGMLGKDRSVLNVIECGH